ncbi:hypothetical protein FXO37_08887 [Capsicum annuum]|nr:hypothetical protein FXO37_08887 [Capsicum annuum]
MSEFHESYDQGKFKSGWYGPFTVVRLMSKSSKDLGDYAVPGTMPVKDVFSSKQMPKKGNKKAQSSSSEATESSRSSDDLYEYPTKGKVDPKGQKSAKRNTVSSPEKTPQRGPKRKTPTTFPPHTPPSLEHPPLVIAPALIPTVERWGYLGMQATYNDSLRRLRTGKNKRNLYLERRLITTEMAELPSQTEAAEMDKTAETDRQTETTQTSAIEGISSAPPPVQSIPSCLKEARRERKKRKRVEKDAMKKAKADSIQDELDRYVRVQQMLARVGGSRTLVIDDAEEGGVADLPSATVTELVSVVDRTHDDISRTQVESLRTDAV